VDEVILRLDNMIRDGIEPRMPSVTPQPVSLSNSSTVLIIRVQRSWSMPHRVTLRGHDRFYGRSSNGKYPLDVGELRTLFNLSATLAEQIKRFREDRISSIVANESFILMPDGAKVVLHLIPLISFNPGQRYDFVSTLDLRGMKPINSGVGAYRYNLDGFLTYSSIATGTFAATSADTYVELFRSGIIEAVDGCLIEPLGEELLIPSEACEKELIKSLGEYLTLMNELAVELPIFLFLSLLNVRGYRMATKAFPSTHAIDRDIVLLPEVVIEDYDTPAYAILKPCFDSIWNACGFPRCQNYDSVGRWKGT
jgi:hypothetical protein